MKLLKEERALLLSLGRKTSQALEACGTVEAEWSGNYPRLERQFDIACNQYSKAKQAIMINHSKDWRSSTGCSA
mgnify:FL=1|tara:strand:- start:94 stop:315 length:222 start_codon:yes stop_codon:yes gene_type:complete